ncbi:MAG: molybdopterin molybdotransferase MoeA [Syntrophales bacterium]|nr:molybdopterin molybdotransferase MoeA [Syntrophales bacterium]
MISVDEAREIILGSISPLRGEKVSLLEALGRVIAEDIYSKRDLPPVNNSAMDGFAVRAEDTWGAAVDKPVWLRVVAEVPAGVVIRRTLGKGEAVKIMTGAPLPEGADAVIRKEEVEERDEKILVRRPIPPGLDVRYAGEDVRAGSLVIAKGTTARPAEIAMCAAVGRSFVSVHQRPRVTIVSTGSELVEIDGEVSPEKIINSNSYALAASVKACGAIPVMLGIVPDERNVLRRIFLEAAKGDLIISSGGVSVGDYDLVKEVMQEAGSELKFWRVAMRPGRPLAFGFIGGVPIFGLPGNPVSSAVSFEQFVRPALRKMMGFKELLRPVVRAVVEEDIEKSVGFRYFIRGVMREEGGRYLVKTTGGQGSGIISSLVKANVLIVLPEEKELVKRGEEVEVQFLTDDYSLV